MFWFLLGGSARTVYARASTLQWKVAELRLPHTSTGAIIVFNHKGAPNHFSIIMDSHSILKYMNISYTLIMILVDVKSPFGSTLHRCIGFENYQLSSIELNQLQLASQRTLDRGLWIFFLCHYIRNRNEFVFVK